MIADESAMHGEETSARYGGLVGLDALTTHTVVTEGGTNVGNVAAIDFDERTFSLRAVEVSPGLFTANQDIPADQVVSIGVDVLVVTDAVCAPEPDEVTGSTPAGEERRYVITTLRAEE
jgi:uncharacterized protein YrrD